MRALQQRRVEQKVKGFLMWSNGSLASDCVPGQHWQCSHKGWNWPSTPCLSASFLTFQRTGWWENGKVIFCSVPLHVHTYCMLMFTRIAPYWNSLACKFIRNIALACISSSVSYFTWILFLFVVVEMSDLNHLYGFASLGVSGDNSCDD